MDQNVKSDFEIKFKKKKIKYQALCFEIHQRKFQNESLEYKVLGKFDDVFCHDLHVRMSWGNKKYSFHVGKNGY